MSQNIKNKLITVYETLGSAMSNIVSVKSDIADALRYNGVTNVSNEETFQRYVELIRKLRSPNSMVLEFTIPESAVTAYKRTVVLPMYFGTNGNNGGSLNAIAKEVISGDTGSYAMTLELDPVEEAPYEEHIIKDPVYGNEISDGNYTITMEDVETYLSEEEADEFLEAAENIGVTIYPRRTTSRASSENGDFEPSTSATYSYKVDWGDGSEECIYDETKAYADNKPAIFHTYEKAGTYDVTINGTYKRIYTQGDDQSNYVENGEYVKDRDGVTVVANNNYGMRYHLVAVIAWGNTLLNNMSQAFRRCEKLASIPMYDTTNSFADVTAFDYVFYRCYSLKGLPFNANTNKGLFSGCKKATTFAYAFGDDTGLTEPIPVKLIDGCTNVTNVQRMFGGCSNMQGGLPVGFFAGMTALSNASEVFDNNTKMNDEISSDLFVDCPNLTTIYRLFYNCTGITGIIDDDFISGKSKLTEMRQAFYNCKGITGITANAFDGLTADNINCRDAFHNCGIRTIPKGLLNKLTGKNLMLERMFDSCPELTSIPSDCIQRLKVANARGMFGNCPKMTCACPDANDDWSTYEGMKRWYGAFARTPLSDISSVCLELGGDGDRKFSEGKVGSIVLEDGTYVEPKNYVYSSSNRPMGIVYADVYLDKTKMVATLANGSGNTCASGDTNAVHKIYATVLADKTDQWCNNQAQCVDITSITNTSNVEVGYNNYTWDTNGSKATLNQTRYNGEAYSKAVNDFRVSQGMATSSLTHDGRTVYTKTSTDIYDAFDYVCTYSANGADNQSCFLPDGADLWDQFTMKHLIQKACDKIIAGGGGFSSSNCFSMRDGAWYWASSESGSSNAWHCGTYNAHLHNWGGKWATDYVRPSLAL